MAIAGQHVAGLGRYEAGRPPTARGLIILPGFIDGDMHIESTKLMVDEFARAVLPSRTTTVVLDPHEVANVFGLDGVRELLRQARGVPVDVFARCRRASPRARSSPGAPRWTRTTSLGS